ncbi:polycystin-1 [Kryptolebias marmoratus]|uniref:polycystin-1 n=1 Tax=Kryptolebias marmoratus TaxID=37003 RepID=UPI0007F93B09|nr:polycystin-1 [Kryptolebias marmoratus]
MTGAARRQAPFWILWGVLITRARGDVPCPNGAQIHLANLQCFWLSDVTSSWFKAQDSCRETWGGSLASAQSKAVQDFLHNRFTHKTTAWIWLNASWVDGPDPPGPTEPQPSSWRGRDGAGQGLCPQMTLGTPGRWRRAQCAEQYPFMCENRATEALPSVENYLTGLVVMTGVYTHTLIQPLPAAPDTGQCKVEMLLFPGLWFSHTGELVSVELVVQPSSESSLARVQILRPYCSPNQHLVPPGCHSLLNAFSCCSALALCNTTGGCSLGRYWCPLLEACVPNARPCSTYDTTVRSRGFTSPPRYPAPPPFYHLVADMPLSIKPSSEFKTLEILLPERGVTVYPDDVVAVQHTRDSGAFLHCLEGDASAGSPWRQSFVTLRGAEWGGWWEGGLTSLPRGSQWVDGAVCNLRVLYEDKRRRATEREDVVDSVHATTAPDVTPLNAGPVLRSNFGVNIIHPPPDEKNHIHVQANIPTIIVVKALFGEKAKSSWSAPVLQTEVPFQPTCPEEVVQFVPDCKTESGDSWFSYARLVLPSPGVQTLNISVTDEDGFQSLSVTLRSHKAVTGLSVEPHGCPRTLIQTSQLFTAKVQSGFPVKFTWVIDNLEKSAQEGESYSIMFEKPAEHELQVVASNPVSSQSLQILLTADVRTPLTEPDFLFDPEAVAVNVPHLYNVRVKVDVSLPVTFKWDFGDGSEGAIHTHSAPCQDMEGLVERGEKHVYVQDSVNHTYSIPGNYTFQVQVSDQFVNTSSSVTISTRPQLTSLRILPSTMAPLVTETLHLEASIKPSTSGVLYTWDFGDASKFVQGFHRKVSHSFESAGVYNVTVATSNTVPSLTASLVVVVVEGISGLTVTYNGPSEAGSPVDFRATVASGTDLIWDFDFGDGSLWENLTDGSISHVYKFSGSYRVAVKVSNSVSQAYQSITAEVYDLTVSGVLPKECVMSGKAIQLSALVNGNISALSFHWAFGQDSPSIVMTGQSTVMHIFPNHGIFHINITVFSSFTTVSFRTSICVESPITHVEMEISQDVVAIGEEVCLRVLVSPKQTTAYTFRWFNTSSGLFVTTERSRRCFVFRSEGVEEVSVLATNRMSNKTANATITVQKPVGKPRIIRDSQGEKLTVNTSTSFGVASCVGSNVSMLWDFGDGSPVENKRNVSHVFTSTGKFTVTTTAFNLVSRDSATLTVNVLLPVSDLSLRTDQPYAVVGQEIVVTAVSSTISITNYYWTVEGRTATKQGTYQFRFMSSKPGVFKVKVMSKNLVSKMEAAIFIEVFERIEGLQVECQSLTNNKYLPTHEDILFGASVAKGSNITYHWDATQSGVTWQIQGDGELFHMTVESPGRISVQVKASNILGEGVAHASLVAVDRVTKAHIATQSNTVVLGKAVNMTVLVEAGSDLQYIWYVNADSSLLTHVPFLLYTFTNLGHNLVTVSVQNVFSQSNYTKQLLVQAEVQEVGFEINRQKHPFFVNVSASLSFHGFAHKGSDLHWVWKVRSVKKTLLTSTNPAFTYSFSDTGIYEVYLNVSNEISWQMIFHDVVVQEPIEGLLLNISKTSLCTQEQVVFSPTITKGNNVSFVIMFQNKDWIQSWDIFEDRFTTISLLAGKHLVTVKALNQVSSAETHSSIVVTEIIRGLRLVNCCFATLEALKGAPLKAEVQSGFPVNYTWTFQLESGGSMWLVGQDVVFTPSESGLLSVTVHASNGVCSQTINDTLTIEWPVKNVKLVCHSQRIFAGHAVRFSATVNCGSNVRYIWDFGDSTEILATSSWDISHLYHSKGKYGILVKALNNVSHVSTQLEVEVEELQCPSPRVSLVQIQPTVFRSRPNLFEAAVDINCSAYKTVYLWEIFRVACFTNETKVSQRTQKDAASPLLLLPKNTLDVGHYCLVFTVFFKGTPLLVQQKTNITVVHSLLVAVIEGGSHRLWPSVSDLIIDGSESYDPDVELGMEDVLEYHWACLMMNSTESPLMKQSIESTNKRMIILRSQLRPGTVCIFNLTVFKNGRRPSSANQTVTVTGAPALPVMVKCVSCSVISSIHHISYSSPVVLAGKCGLCDDQAQYKWRAEDQSGLPLDLNDITTSTGRRSPKLVVRSSVLQSGRSYSFVLNVSQPGSMRWGGASLTIQASGLPRDGVCELSPESQIQLLETVVTYSCSGWHDDDSETSQLIYTFQVAPFQPSSPVYRVLTLYRGTRSTFSCLVPMGSPGQKENTTVITVTVIIENHLGAKVTALNRTLIVENPQSDQADDQWIRNKSQTELWALVQHANPQEIIPYSIALISKLNQMKFGGSAEELANRREIRENATQALVSVPVSSLQDVDQLSSALTQSTAVPSELISESCHEGVLEAVGQMIHVIDQKARPTDLPSLDLGRNILDIIGSTIAAVSESTGVSSSHSANSRRPQAVSVVTSALSHAGALMRAFVHSRVLGDAAILFSNSYIKTLGFHGDPLDLLCSHQSNQSNRNPTSRSSSAEGFKSSPLCPFLIPTSLSAHLRRQSSEVVQVWFCVDGALESNPLLSAADPPISTTVAAMELTTPQGQPIPIQDLDPEQAIRVTLLNRSPVTQGNAGGNWRVSEDRNGTCLAVTLPNEEQLNFTVRAPDDLHENAGLYISFIFSLAPGATSVSLGHVKIKVISATNASQDSLVRESALTLSAETPSSEETIFLSPLLSGTDRPLSVSLASSLNNSRSVQVSVCIFSSLCQYYDVKDRRWRSEGLRSLEGSTLHTTLCLAQHLTMFGASLFLHPGAVVLLPPADEPMQNMVVGIVCAVLVALHLLVGLIAHKLDHLDRVRLSQVPLCGRPGLYHYRVLVKTGLRPGAGTTAHVGICLYGVSKSGSRHLQRDGAFQRCGLDQFQVETDDNLGEIWKIRIWHDNTGLDPSWYIQHVVVWDPQTDHMFFFVLEEWLSVANQKNSTVEREVLASCPEELTQFRRVFTSQLIFGMAEGNLWLSVWERPAHSSFTRGQRVACSALMLHLYLALGTLWFGAVGMKNHSGTVSAHLLVNGETVAVGMVIALLVFPLQCFLCFLFRKAGSQVTLDVSAPPSPVCRSVEMDICHIQSEISGPSFLSFSDSSGLFQESPSSLLESKALDSRILDFWTASGLVPQMGVPNQDGVTAWSSHDSLLSLPEGSGPPKMIPPSTAQRSTRQLKRKKAVTQLHLASPVSPFPPSALLSSLCSHSLIEGRSRFNSSSAQPSQKYPHPSASPVEVHNHNRATLLTLSEEDLLMSIAAAEDASDAIHSNSDSGRDSPRTTTSFTASPSTSWSSWSEGQGSSESLDEAEIGQPEAQVNPSLFGEAFYKCSSVLSMESVASTFLPDPLHESICSSSTTRIGVARGQPGWFLPPWVLRVVYPLITFLIGACLAVVGLYGSLFSKAVLLMWLVSALTAFFTSIALLEPLKACVQALICAVLWGPVDPEVEELLAQETTVVRTSGVSSRNIRPPCGYGLLQAKEEARKTQALRSLMRHCVGQLVFLLLVLMVNYQDRLEQTQARLLCSTVRQLLHTAPAGCPNLTSLKDWSEAERWTSHSLVKHLHQTPQLQLVGLPRLQFSPPPDDPGVDLLGNASAATLQLLAAARISDAGRRGHKTLCIDFTQRHRESGVFLCVSVRLEPTGSHGVASFLSVRPLLAPPSLSAPDLRVALTVFLLVSALVLQVGELRAAVRERAQCIRRRHRWFQLLLSCLSLATAVLQLRSLSLASGCVYKIRSERDDFVDFHGAALLAERSSQCAAVLLLLLVLKLLGTFRFAWRWVMIGRVVQGAQRKLWAIAILTLLLLLTGAHLGHALFSQSVEGFLSVKQSGVSTMSLLCNQSVLRKLCRVHPVLGPLYGLLVLGSSIWLLAKLCGAILMSACRVRQAEVFQLAMEPHDYEMVEFFIKRLKLWMGLTKAKQFRHRVKFEGMDFLPSRSSRESCFSSLSPTRPSPQSPSSSPSIPSPRPLSCVGPEDLSLFKPRLEVRPILDSLEPTVSALLSRFDRVNQLTEDIYDLELQLEKAQDRWRKRRMSHGKKREMKLGGSEEPKEPGGERVTGEVRRRKVGLFYPSNRVLLPSFYPFSPSTPQTPAALLCSFPRVRSSYSESESAPFQPRPSGGRTSLGVTLTAPAAPVCGPSDSAVQFPRRRAWHSGSSRSADAAQRASQSSGVAPNTEENLTFPKARPGSEEQENRCICSGVPLKRKAWISESEEDPVFTSEENSRPQPVMDFVLN